MPDPGQSWKLRELQTGTGIYGMDFYVHLSRPGSRVKNRKLKVGKVGAAHKLRKDDGMKWFQTKYDGILLN